MKHLKSTLPNLRELFERSITVKDIAEPLISFDAERLATDVRQFLETRKFDMVGVRREGIVLGYARRKDLSCGSLGDYLRSFNETHALADATPLLEIFKELRDRNEVFIVLLGQVSGIVTRGDLQKAPVRMWLFGLISILEMQLLRIIRDRYPNERWKDVLKPKRLEAAQNVLSDRIRRNTNIDLTDCLQVCDKRDILLADKELLQCLGLDPKTTETLFKEYEKLRNELAHAQDIITGQWPRIVDLANQIENLLRKCEEISFMKKP